MTVQRGLYELSKEKKYGSDGISPESGWKAVRRCIGEAVALPGECWLAALQGPHDETVSGNEFATCQGMTSDLRAAEAHQKPRVLELRRYFMLTKLERLVETQNANLLDFKGNVTIKETSYSSQCDQYKIL